MSNTLPANESGATVVISHKIKAWAGQRYEDWLVQISEAYKKAEGFSDWQIVRPLKGLSGTYTIIIRFTTEESLKNWMFSETRKQLVHQIQDCFETDDDFFIRTGLDFWFTPSEAKAKIPVAWKQYLIPWSIKKALIC